MIMAEVDTYTMVGLLGAGNTRCWRAAGSKPPVRVLKLNGVVNTKTSEKPEVLVLQTPNGGFEACSAIKH
jgi:hypothetical protein